MTNRLIEELEKRQREAGLSQEQFAEHLGISQSMLSRLYAGKRELGIESLQCIVRAYPELAYLFFAENIRSGKTVSVETTVAPASPQAHGDAP